MICTKYFILIFYWIFYSFTFYMLSPFLVSPLQILHPIPLPFASKRIAPPHTHPSTPTSLPFYPPMLGHQAFTGPRASSPIDARQDHPLLHMQLEPWVPPCVLFNILIGLNHHSSWAIV